MLLGQANKPSSDVVKQEMDFGWLNRWFEEAIPQSEVRWVIWIAGAAILVAIAFYVVNRIRGLGSFEYTEAADLAEFQDLYVRGAFSEEEMTKVKQTIRSNYDPPVGKDIPFESEETQPGTIDKRD